MTVGVWGGGRGVGVVEGIWQAQRSGCEMGVGGGSVRPTPHLASPLEGGRDELGKGWCLVGWWRWWGGSFQ